MARAHKSVLMGVLDHYDLIPDSPREYKRYLSVNSDHITQAYQAYNAFGYRVVFTAMPKRRLAADIFNLVDRYHGLNFPVPFNLLDEEILQHCRALYLFSQNVSIADMLSVEGLQTQFNHFFDMNKVIALHGKDGIKLLNPNPDMVGLPRAVDDIRKENENPTVQEASRFVMDLISYS
jgi:hypothetical protein